MKEVVRLIAQLQAKKVVLLSSPRCDAAEINAIEHEIFSLTVALEILRRRLPQKSHPRRDVIDPRSSVGIALTVLRDAGVPLHIDEILDRMRKMHGCAAKKNSLTSRLSKLAKAERVFTLLRRGTYGLVEQEHVPRRKLAAAQAINDTVTALAARGSDNE